MAADNEAFTAFVASRQRRLQHAAWLLTGDAALAEDLVQDALAKTWRHWRRVCAADSADAYVHRVLANTFVSGRRRRWWSERPTGTAYDETPSTAASGGASDDRVSLNEALLRLPLRQRAVLVLRFYADLSVEQVADILNCAPGTVKSTTSKAIQQLRDDPSVNALVEEIR